MRRLVVPTDFSPFAQEALLTAMTLRRRTGADIHLLHIVSPSDASPEAREENGLRRALREALEGADATSRDVTCAIRYAYAVAPAILTYADEVDADAIVSGTHGRRGVQRLMLGSVAEEMVRTAPIDVLVTPSGLVPRFSARPPRRILVPVDMRDGSEALVARARDLAASLGAEQVDLLHVLPPLPYPVRWIDDAVSDLVPTIRDKASAELREMADRVGLVNATIHIERGVPADVIRRVADALGSELLVLAPHELGRVARVLLGSVAGDVARMAGRPVLIARSLVPDARTLNAPVATTPVS